MDTFQSLESVREEAVAQPKTNLQNPADVVDAERKVVYLPTSEAYDRWSSVYDTDGNFLQALDNRELKTMLPEFLGLAGVSEENSAEQPSLQKTIVDLGCGTGRVTLQIVALRPRARIVCLDGSLGMLSIARSKVGAELANNNVSEASKDLESLSSPQISTNAVSNEQTLSFGHVDIAEYGDALIKGSATEKIINWDVPESGSTVTSPKQLYAGSANHIRIVEGQADAIVSTLVLEHVPLQEYFAVAKALLKPSGWLLVTNMHDEMGRISQAGFVDIQSGEKIRPKSFAHSVQEVTEEASKWGFQVFRVYEKAVGPEDVEQLGPRSKKWVGIKCWYGFMFRKIASGPSTD